MNRHVPLLLLLVCAVTGDSVNRLSHDQWSQRPDRQRQKDEWSAKPPQDLYEAVLVASERHGMDLSDNRHALQLTGLRETSCKACLVLAGLVSDLLLKNFSHSAISNYLYVYQTFSLNFLQNRCNTNRNVYTLNGIHPVHFNKREVLGVPQNVKTVFKKNQ